MAYKEQYITYNEYLNSYKLSFTGLYEGFVIGYGYVYPKSGYCYPDHWKGYASESQNIPANETCCVGFWQYEEEISIKTIKLSLRGLFKNDGIKIKIKSGWTLSYIATVFNVTVDELILWNKIKNPDNILANQEILINNTANLLNDDHKQDNTANTLFDALVETLSWAGNIVTVKGGLIYTDDLPFLKIGGYWKGQNGQYYKSALALRESGKGWNFRANSREIAKNSSNYFRIVGNDLEYIVTENSVLNFIDNRIGEDGLDAAFGIGGIIYWPVGVG